jgi:pantoate kinase
LPKSQLKTAKAFAPAAISSFFEICDTQNGKPIADLERVGARGGGFGLQKGTTTTLTAEKAEKTSIQVFINKKPVLQNSTTQKVIETLLSKTNAKYSITVEHEVEVPIGMGFGTSAAGALNAGLALADALDLPLTYNQIGKVAHVAEIECQTGLGTVSSLTFGGKCILVTEPGAPGICQTDRIPVSPNYTLVAGFFDSKIPKSSIFSSPQRKQEITQIGKETMQKILKKPCVENFLDCCWTFSQKAGFATEKVRHLVALAQDAGAVGCAQNMVGEAVHCLVEEEKADCVAQAFMQVLPYGNVIVSKLDALGVRLIK